MMRVPSSSLRETSGAKELATSRRSAALCDLPAHVLEALIVGGGLSCGDVCALACTQRPMGGLLRDSSLCERLCEGAGLRRQHPLASTMPAAALVRLAGVDRCQRCPSPRCEVQWSFGTRLCRRCLDRATVSCRRCQDFYGLPPRAWKAVPKERMPGGELCMLKDHLLPLLLPLLLPEDDSFEARETRLRREAAAQRAETLRRWCEQAGLAPESLALSPHFRRHSKMSTPLTRAGFGPVLRKVREEVRRAERKGKQVT
jgi:hypothetical protein